MNSSEKNKIKDILILSLIDSLSEIYSVNLNINKNKIYESIVSKLNDFDILDIESDETDIQHLKSKLINYITNDITNEIQLYNPDRQISFFSNFNETTKIGQGGNGWVYKAYNPIDENTYAIKKIGVKRYFSEVLNEVRAMAKFNHINVVRYYSTWIESGSIENKINLITEQTNNSIIKYSSDNSDWGELDENNYNKFLFIQMELCDCNLKEYLNKNSISNEEKKEIGLQILSGIKYIHSKNYIHRDLKLSNIFYGFDGRIKIGDFGLATNIKDLDYDDVGTIGYIAPEIMNGSVYNELADLYSLGIVFLEIFCDIKTDMEKMHLIEDARDNNLNLNLDKDVEMIINGLINVNPENRYNTDKCISLLKK